MSNAIGNGPSDGRLLTSTPTKKSPATAVGSIAVRTNVLVPGLATVVAADASSTGSYGLVLPPLSRNSSNCTGVPARAAPVLPGTPYATEIDVINSPPGRAV